MSTQESFSAWLWGKADSYKADARKMADLDASDAPHSGALDWKQMGIVYRTVGQELEKCARECSDAEPERDEEPGVESVGIVVPDTATGRAMWKCSTCGTRAYGFSSMEAAKRDLEEHACPTTERDEEGR